MSEGKHDDDDGKQGDDSQESMSVLAKVQQFCLSTSLEQDFEAFAKEHHEIFLQSLDFPPDSTEHPLEFHSVYQDYLRKFEGRIERFIESEGFTINQFYDECKNILENDKVYGSQRFFVEALMATAEYENFFMLMRSEMHKYRK